MLHLRSARQKLNTKMRSTRNYVVLRVTDRTYRSINRLIYLIVQRVFGFEQKPC